MARITVEDCLEQESNRFALVKLASIRAKQLLEGKSAVTDTKGNRAIVSALREIAAGKIHFRPAEENTPGNILPPVVHSQLIAAPSSSTSSSEEKEEETEARDSANG